MTPEPCAWMWIDEDGIRRQAKIHTTRDGVAVVWSPRCLGDPYPWFDADYDSSDVNARYEDADLITLGVPVSFWAGFGI
ncbi:hypothetical protein [Streptomyces sp. NPDC059009]|uniref:hypothetical protein n=1 Tax=Streptomyces sp. NPDC059009 TaxID=3346694 RepID=UPI003677D8EB